MLKISILALSAWANAPFCKKISYLCKEKVTEEANSFLLLYMI